MAQAVLALCEACGKGYAARLVGDRLVLPTSDGCCACGGREFQIGTEGAEWLG